MSTPTRMLVIAALVLSGAAHAESPVSLEIGIQSGRYGTQGDGTWYQTGMPHVLNIHSYGFTAGLTGALIEREKWGINWHVDYVNLGHISSTCDCTPIDENYNAHTHELVSDPIPVANAQFVGNGNAQGVAFTLEPYYRLNNWRFSVEGGFFPYRPAWDETIYNWQVQPGLSQTLHVSTPHAIQLGAVAGVGVSWKNSSVFLRHYWLPTKFDSSHSPALFTGATVLEYKYRF